MIKKVILLFALFALFCCTNKGNQTKQNVIIPKDNGNIILAYKGFENFLNSGKNWNDYEEYVLKAFPALMAMHRRYISVGLTDTVLFKKEVSGYHIDDFRPYLTTINEEKIIKLYNSVIQQMDSILNPLKKVDFCFYLSNGRDVFVQDVSGRQTIYVSIKYDMKDMYLALAHEYAHCLHHQRRPEEPSVLKKWIVSEGIASYFPVLLSEEYSIYDGLWMMPEENVDWCKKNEKMIIDSIIVDLDKNGLEIQKKYICGGEGFAEPPKGFPEKTAYYIGYKIVEKCLENGIHITDLCTMDSKTVINKSNIFPTQDDLF